MLHDFQREYLIRLPLPLAQLYQRAYNDKSAQSRHNNTFYLFEALIKLATAPAVAAYLHEVVHGERRVPEIDRLLVHLALPSLGQWVGMLRGLARHFGTRPDSSSHPLGHVWDQLNRLHRDQPGLLALYRRIKNGLDGSPSGDLSCSLMQVIDCLVPYRNAVFGHGAGRFDSFYENEMGPLFFPAANELLSEGMLDMLGPRGSRLVHLAELRMLDENRVEVGIRELVGERSARTAPLDLTRDQSAALAPGLVAVVWPGRAVPLRLDPMLLFREGELGDEVLFLNRDRNGRQVEYLSYTRGEPQRDPGTAPALARLLSRVTDRPIATQELDAFFQQSMAETPTVEILLGAPPAPARVLGDYEILAELGRGGMGVVYLARQVSLGRIVALKMLPADLSGDEVTLARFRREMRLLARCDHRNIVKVLSSGTLPDGRLYYCMEYVPGSDLEHVWAELAHADGVGNISQLGSSTWARAVVSASRKQWQQSSKSKDTASDAPPLAPEMTLPPIPDLPSSPEEVGGYVRKVAALMRDAALALQAVHDQQVIHRDVKPANLMLTADGTRVVLMDFGLAKSQDMQLTSSRAGGLLGTLRYAAPEQLAAATLRVGPEADVRGLGVTLWELLTHRRLFADAQDERQLASMVHDQDVPRIRTIDPGLDRDLEAIVARATERRVADRIPNAGQLAEYLGLYLEGKPLPIRPPSIAELAGRWARRHRAMLGAVASVLLVTASLVTGLKVSSDLRLHRLQVEAERDVEQGEAALLSGDAGEAQRLLAGAVGKIGSNRQLESLRDRAVRLLKTAESRVTEQIDLQRDRQRFDTFMKNYDDALLNGTLFTGRNSGIERARSAAWKALAEFGCKEDRAGTIPENLASLRLEDREKARLKVCCYELLRILSLLDQTPTARSRDANSRATRASELVDRARRLAPTSEAAKIQAVAARPDGEEPGVLAARDVELDLFRAVDRFLLGLANYYAKDNKAAARQFEGVLQAYPDHYWSHYFLALSNLRERRWPEARGLFSGCLSRKPSSPWPLMLRGYVAGEMGEFDAAELDFARALEIVPDDYGILVNRGAMRIRHGKFKEASDDLRRAIKTEPQQFEAYSNLARVFSAQGQWQGAIEQMNRAIKCSPQVALLHRNRARIYLDSRNPLNQELAAADFAKAIELEPANSPFLKLFRAEERLAKNEFEKAIAEYDLYEKAGAPDAQFYQGRGLAHAFLRHYPEAFADYSRSLELEPNSNVYARRGWAILTAADELARHEFERSLATNARNIDARAGLGNALVRLGKVEEAIQQAELALPPGVNVWQMKYNVASIYSQAVAAVRKEASTPERATLGEKCKKQAETLLRAALERANSDVRAVIWRELKGDSAFNPIRDSAGFVRLQTEFGGQKN
jgi:serine/threonine protein kinase/tetratricopeptide (TPR) repeat protein